MSYEIQFVLSWNPLAWCRLSWIKDKLSRHVSMVWRGTAVAPLPRTNALGLLQSCARPSMCAYTIFYLFSTLAAHTNMYLIIWTIAHLRPSAWRYMLNCVINYFLLCDTTDACHHSRVPLNELTAQKPWTLCLLWIMNYIYIFTLLKHCPFLYHTGCFLSISIQYDITEVLCHQIVKIPCPPSRDVDTATPGVTHF